VIGEEQHQLTSNTININNKTTQKQNNQNKAHKIQKESNNYHKAKLAIQKLVVNHNFG